MKAILTRLLKRRQPLLKRLRPFKHKVCLFQEFSTLFS